MADVTVKPCDLPPSPNNYQKLETPFSTVRSKSLIHSVEKGHINLRSKDTAERRRMRRPASASTHRPFWHAAPNAVDVEQRETTLLLTRRERGRRAQAPYDSIFFDSMRDRMRYFHELSQRRRARTRESAVAELKGEKSLPMVIVVFSDTDGGSYQGGHGVKNVCVDDPTVYCSHKRNNVNITFEHAVANIPFELTKIIVKTPLVGYSSPVREGLVYVSMERVEYKDTERYDRQDNDESKSSAIWLDPLDFNLPSRRREREIAPPSSGRKEIALSNRTPSGSSCLPMIPKWGTPASHKRNESEPVVSFQIARGISSTEIMFSPPITGRYILIKLFNDFYDDALNKPNLDRQERPQRRVLTRERVPDDIPPVGDPLRFDNIDDDLEDEQVAAILGSEGHQEDVDFENVDVQAILFYGYTGKRRFPSLKDL